MTGSRINHFLRTTPCGAQAVNVPIVFGRLALMLLLFSESVKASQKEQLLGIFHPMRVTLVPQTGNISAVPREDLAQNEKTVWL